MDILSHRLFGAINSTEHRVSIQWSVNEKILSVLRMADIAKFNK